MRRVWVVLAAVGFLMPGIALADAPEESGEQTQVILDRLGKMELPEQQAWLKRLEARADRAARLTLSPDEAAAQQKQTRSKLHRKLVTWQILRDVIEDTSAREKDAIERLSQRYRRLVDETYAKQPAALAERQMAWLDLRNEWKLGGSIFGEQDLLIDWLEKNIEEVAKTEPLEEATETAGVKPEAVEEATSKPQTAEELTETEPETEPATEPSVAGELDKTEEPAESPMAENAAEEEPETAEVKPQTTENAEEEAAEPSPATEPVVAGALDKTEESAEPQAADEAAKEEPEIVDSESPATEKAVDEAREDKPTEVASLGLPTETRVAPPSAKDAPATEAKPAEELPSDSVEIKVDELAARIGGCNMAFRALEMELDEKGLWSAARLEPLVERLELLAIRRNDLDLFREAVPEEKRESLDELASLKDVVAQVAGRIVDARANASKSTAKGTDRDRQAELRRLEALSQRLAGLSEP